MAGLTTVAGSALPPFPTLTNADEDRWLMPPPPPRASLRTMSDADPMELGDDEPRAGNTVADLWAIMQASTNGKEEGKKEEAQLAPKVAPKAAPKAKMTASNIQKTRKDCFQEYYASLAHLNDGNPKEALAHAKRGLELMHSIPLESGKRDAQIEADLHYLQAKSEFMLGIANKGTLDRIQFAQTFFAQFTKSAADANIAAQIFMLEGDLQASREENIRAAAAYRRATKINLERNPYLEGTAHEALAQCLRKMGGQRLEIMTELERAEECYKKVDKRKDLDKSQLIANVRTALKEVVQEALQLRQPG